MRKLIFPVLFILFFVASCTITQEYHFNKDMSGTATTQVDLSMMMEFMSGLDTTDSDDNSMDTLDQSLAEAAAEYEALGAKNVEYGWNDDSTVLYVSYDFKDLDHLNELVGSGGGISEMFGGKKESDESEKAEAPEFSKGWFFGTTFKYDAPDIANDTLFSGDEMASMKDYYQYKLIFSFDQEIKKVDNENAVMSPDGKSIEFSGSMMEMFSEDYSADFKLKLK